MTRLTQGVYFSIDTERLGLIAAWARGLNRGVVVDTEDILDLALDTDWPNAAEHQAWLDSASPSEIASWATDLCLEMLQAQQRVAE